MKRFLIGLMLVLTLGGMLAACGVKNPPEYKPESPKPATTKSAS